MKPNDLDDDVDKELRQGVGNSSKAGRSTGPVVIVIGDEQQIVAISKIRESVRRERDEELNALDEDVNAMDLDIYDSHDDDYDECIPMCMIILYISRDIWVGMGIYIKRYLRLL